MHYVLKHPGFSFNVIFNFESDSGANCIMWSKVVIFKSVELLLNVVFSSPDLIIYYRVLGAPYNLTDSSNRLYKMHVRSQYIQWFISSLIIPGVHTWELMLACKKLQTTHLSYKLSATLSNQSSVDWLPYSPKYLQMKRIFFNNSPSPAKFHNHV